MRRVRCEQSQWNGLGHNLAFQTAIEYWPLSCNETAEIV